jgi:hypothetical protein
MLQEHLDFNVTAKIVAQSASRALGLLIAMCKSAAGLPDNDFTHLYDTSVRSIISYGSAFWGFLSYSCIIALQFRTMLFLFGVGRYTPNVAVSGGIRWIPPEIRQRKSIAIHLSRMSYMLDCRVNKRVALWSASAANRTCKNCFFYVYITLKICNAHQHSDIRISIPKHTIVKIVTTKLQEEMF